MNSDFYSILSDLLQDYETSTGKDIDQIVSERSAKYEISQQSKERIAEASLFVDKITSLSKSLRDAKDEGTSRKKWIVDEYESIMHGRTDEEKAELADAVSSAAERQVNSVLTENEQ